MATFEPGMIVVVTAHVDRQHRSLQGEIFQVSEYRRDNRVMVTSVRGEGFGVWPDEVTVLENPAAQALFDAAYTAYKGLKEIYFAQYFRGEYTQAEEAVGSLEYAESS